MSKINPVSLLVLALLIAACGGSAEKPVDGSAPVPTSTCWYIVDGCKYSTPILGEGTRELSCPAELDYAAVVDVVCGEAALPSCHSVETCQ